MSKVQPTADIEPLTEEPGDEVVLFLVSRKTKSIFPIRV